MLRASVVALAFSALLVLTGCGRSPLPANPSVPKDQAELEARYNAIEAGAPESEIAAFMGKRGAEVAGYSTQMLKRKPEGDVNMAAGESDKHWASIDGAGAIRVVFRSDGKARVIELLRMTPMGPVPRSQGESKDP